MNIADWIVTGAIVVVLGLAGWYVYRAKKKGQKCIGCAQCGGCPGHCKE